MLMCCWATAEPCRMMSHLQWHHPAPNDPTCGFVFLQWNKRRRRTFNSCKLLLYWLLAEIEGSQITRVTSGNICTRLSYSKTFSRVAAEHLLLLRLTTTNTDTQSWAVPAEDDGNEVLESLTSYLKEKWKLQNWPGHMWELFPGWKCYTMKNGRSLIGFVGTKHPTSLWGLVRPSSLRVILNTHTHVSPLWRTSDLRVKPQMTSFPFGNLTGTWSVERAAARVTGGNKMVIIMPSRVMSRAYGPQYITAGPGSCQAAGQWVNSRRQPKTDVKYSSWRIAACLLTCWGGRVGLNNLKILSLGACVLCEFHACGKPEVWGILHYNPNQRWWLFLQAGDLDERYVKGTADAMADALSRALLAWFLLILLICFPGGRVAEDTVGRCSM